MLSHAPTTAPTPAASVLPRMTLRDAYTEFCFAKDHSRASRDWYAYVLTAFMGWCEQNAAPDLENLTAPLVRRYIDFKRTTPSPTTGRPLDASSLHGHVRGIRAFLNWAAEEGLLDPTLPRRIKLPKKEQKVLATLTAQQVERLFLAAEQSGPRQVVARNIALLAVLLDTGLRANELCSLERADVHLSPEDSYLLVREGKGRKQRTVGLGKRARLALARYLRTHTGSHVFIGLRGPLTPSGLDQTLYALRDLAGQQHFVGVKVSAHTLRRTFAVAYLTAGGGIGHLSRLMGHAQTSTTDLYLKTFTSQQARQAGISPLDSLGA